MSKIHQVFSYLSYWLNQENEHSLHAPYVYDLYKNVIINKHSKKQFYQEIEKVRSQFERSDKTIELNGLGSKSNVSSANKISSIAKYGVTKTKYNRLLDRLIDYLEAKTIIEFGTSLGINTLYLASEKDRKVYTFEGNSSLCAISQAVFEGNNRSNIEIIEGDINDQLPPFLQAHEKIDFIFFDANHTYQATKEYFDLTLRKAHDKTCFIFDDIHRDSEMEKVWAEIKARFETTLTIDLFQIGIVFINPELSKQDYTLTF